MKKKTFIALKIFGTVFLLIFTACTNTIENNNNSIVFDLSNSKALFLGSDNSYSSRCNSRNIERSSIDNGNTILYKQTENGEIEKAVTGTEDIQFIITNILRNPVSQEIFLTGYMNGYNLIRIDKDNNWYGLRADDYHYYENSGFDKDGAFYFTTSSATPLAPNHLWKYNGHSHEAISLAESEDFISLSKIFMNGYILYSSNYYFLRAPDGSLKYKDICDAGTYSKYNNVCYYEDKGFDFSTMEIFDSKASNVLTGDDFDVKEDHFISYESN